MGEERRKSRHRAEILRTESRCIYCEELPTTVEHMPPIGMFKRNQRLSGYEFACCDACNRSTSRADVFVQVLARLRPFKGDLSDPLFLEAQKKIASLESLSPGLRAELFRESKATTRWVQRPTGLLQQVVEVSADGPITAGHLCVFGAKLGMALYREHLHAPLPTNGAVFVQPFLNGGLSQQQANSMLRILPGYSTLKQGSRNAGDEFGYRFNCDARSIVAAFVEFHANIYFFVIATSEPEVYRQTIGEAFCAEISPGRLQAGFAITSIVPVSRRPLG